MWDLTKTGIKPLSSTGRRTPHQKTLYLFLIIPFFISVARYLNGHELGQTPGDDEGQGGLAWCSPRGCRVGHTWVTEQQPPRVVFPILSQEKSHHRRLLLALEPHNIKQDPSLQPCVSAVILRDADLFEQGFYF